MGKNGAGKRLTVLAIPPTCDGDWDSMEGAGATRNCGHCSTPVHNISAMTDVEVAEIMAAKGKTCIVYAYRPDGTILRTAQAAGRRAPSKIALGMAAALAYPAAFAGIQAAVGEAEPVAAQSESSEIKIACGIKLMIKTRKTPSQVPAIPEVDSQPVTDAPSLTTQPAPEPPAPTADEEAGLVSLAQDYLAWPTQPSQIGRVVNWGLSGVMAAFALLALGWRRRRDPASLAVLDAWSIPQLMAVGGALGAVATSSLVVTVFAGIAVVAGLALARTVQHGR